MHYTLSQLPIGSSGIITAIEGDDTLVGRLVEMGLTPQASVEMLQHAPMGDPIEISLRGYRLCLRRDDAQCVRVSQAVATADVGGHPAVSLTLVPRVAEAVPPVSQRAPSEPFWVAIAGNPNVGKTTLFNQLTGASARVGNYPGITVDRRVGRLRHHPPHPNIDIDLIDIPGIYSIYGQQPDEQVAITELDHSVDAVLVILNATALTRSLYLLLQLAELGHPVIGVVNMLDEAKAAGIQLDLPLLSEQLGLPILGVVARTGAGVDAVKQSLVAVLSGAQQPRKQLQWQLPPAIERLLSSITPAVTQHFSHILAEHPQAIHPLTFWCLMSVSKDDTLQGITDALRSPTYVAQETLKSAGIQLPRVLGIARYQLIDSLVAVKNSASPGAPAAPTLSKIDQALTHPISGLAVFAVVLALLFTAMFQWAAPVMDLINSGFAQLGDAVRLAMGHGLFARLLSDGVVAGIGAVVVFLPQIILLSLVLTFLEGSGYMARVAFLMDRIMRALHLPGRAIVPMISGYACAIPAIMATRTLGTTRERLLTMMVIPLLSCSARLPVYTLIISTLFPAEHKVGPVSVGVLMMGATYLCSAVLSFAAAAVLGRTLFKGKKSPFFIELPPFRWPTMQTVVSVLWQRTRAFLTTAGSVIVVASVVLWVLLHYPRLPLTDAPPQLREAAQLEYSIAGRIGKVIEPVIAPLGYDWKIGIGLFGSFAAREVFVATMGLVYGVGDVDEANPQLQQKLRAQRHPDGRHVFTPLTGLSLIVFFMIAMQCVSTLAIVKQESKSWRWPIFMTTYLTIFAYVAALAVYQIGRLMGFA